MRALCVLGAASVMACGGSAPPSTAPVGAAPVAAAPVGAAPVAAAAGGEALAATTLALPGAGPDGVAMDYLLYNPRTNTVWVPAGNTGAVDVVDAATGAVKRIDGFATRELEVRGQHRKVGPSAASLGERGTVYIGSRGDQTVCAFDEVSFAKRACATLDAMPDGVAYVAKTHEVWVTTPRDRSIRVLDAATLAQKARLAFDGEPEGFAPDNARGRFYTNLEDKDVTLAIDLASHQTVATWKAGCGEDGPHGLRLAEPDGFLLVACSTRVESLDVGHGGAALGSVAAGDGIDDLDYDPATRRVYAGGGKSATLTVAALDAKGALAALASVATRPGARNGVVTAAGQVYLSHSKASELVVVSRAK